jgi:hypothetical protein
MMGRTGPVFEDRYHAHVLRTPTEVRNAVRYVLGNFENHEARRGRPRSTKGWVDPFSSAARRAPREEQLSLFVEPATDEPETWLLRASGGPVGHPGGEFTSRAAAAWIARAALAPFPPSRVAGGARGGARRGSSVPTTA